ncbi:hypothetical protein EAI_12809 [Harpegnathos saltator]|uniref:Uncharacterized protein n=1 Tax=Harpegnathos saltator TaxID=610380 RepID=E2C5L8_HARSA|nr:hypothetical protein EAI_12809 [Harpegnathos saltator]
MAKACNRVLAGCKKTREDEDVKLFNQLFYDAAVHTRQLVEEINKIYGERALLRRQLRQSKEWSREQAKKWMRMPSRWGNSARALVSGVETGLLMKIPPRLVSAGLETPWAVAGIPDRRRGGCCTPSLVEMAPPFPAAVRGSARLRDRVNRTLRSGPWIGVKHPPTVLPQQRETCGG